MVCFGAISEVPMDEVEDGMCNREYDLVDDSPWQGAAVPPQLPSFHFEDPTIGSRYGLGHMENLPPEPWEKPVSPWLLGNELGQSPLITVKNTFINITDDDDECGVPVVSAKSCPVVRLPSFQAEMVRSRPRARTFQVGAVEGAAADDSPAYVMTHQLSESMQAATAMTPAATAAAGWSAGQEDEPKPGATSLTEGAEELEAARPWLAGRVPAWSVGASLHAARECRPCAWFWRPQGCENAEDCRHCHLCPQGEIKARRKARVTAARRQQRQDRET